MGFKLYSDSLVDQPLLACDVCGLRISDIWNDKATGSPGQDGQVTDIIIHHAACVAAGTIHMQLVDFIRLFVISARPGDLSSNGQVDQCRVEYPMGGRFEI
jgi:hypothetical protein